MQEDILIYVVDVLERLEISYMITGSIAVSYYGIPRLTHDVDIIIEIGAAKVEEVASSFGEGFYISGEAIRDAVMRRGMFNAIHSKSGFKVDFWLVKKELYDQTRFNRKMAHRLLGRDVYITSPEDLLIIKLIWHKDSGSDKHFQDALGLYRMQVDSLDMKYLRKWCDELSVLNFFIQLQHEAKGET